MDYSYVINIGDSPVEIEVTDRTQADKNQTKRLMTYYAMFLKSKIKTDGDKKKAALLDKIINSLSDEGIIDMMSKLKDESGQEDVVDTVNELLDAYADEDDSNVVDEVINGNTFTYEKDFPIDKFRDNLFAVGNEVQGKSWRVELDSDGEVVLFE